MSMPDSTVGTAASVASDAIVDPIDCILCGDLDSAVHRRRAGDVPKPSRGAAASSSNAVTSERTITVNPSEYRTRLESTPREQRCPFIYLPPFDALPGGKQYLALVGFESAVADSDDDGVNVADESTEKTMASVAVYRTDVGDTRRSVRDGWEKVALYAFPNKVEHPHITVPVWTKIEDLDGAEGHDHMELLTIHHVSLASPCSCLGETGHIRGSTYTATRARENPNSAYRPQNLAKGLGLILTDSSEDEWDSDFEASDSGFEG